MNLESYERKFKPQASVTGEQIYAPNKIQTISADGTESPFAFTTATTTIDIPENAIELVFSASSDLKIFGPSDTGHFIKEANSWHSIGVADTKQLSIAGVASGTLQFYFNVL